VSFQQVEFSLVFENASLLKEGPVADGWSWFLCQAAVGILHYAQQQQGVELKESWYEELQRWDEALEAYERKAQQAQTHHQALEATLGEREKLRACVDLVDTRSTFSSMNACKVASLPRHWS
jgi:hypothetical protein